MTRVPRIAKLNTVEKFQEYLQQANIELPFDGELLTGDDAPLAQPTSTRTHDIGNRFCILPMEGWDGTTDGKPTDLTRRRWRRFGESGAKLIWGGEAVAVRPDGRANPNQLMINDETLSDFEELRLELIRAHESCFETSEDLCLGLQLTHSGRFARPNKKTLLEPQTVYRHPILDEKFNVDSASAILTDDEIKALIDDFVRASKLAEKAGFQWVDIKHCHGYFGHELLTGVDRTGEFGGNFENRTRFLRDIVEGIQSQTKQLKVGVRISIFDFVPHKPDDETRIGKPMQTNDYRYGFGCGKDGTTIDFDEPKRFLQLLADLGIELVCTTAGSPYYVPHIQRPAVFPPSDGYLPPEDPLISVTRQISATAELKKTIPNLTYVGSGYSYLQDWLPNVAQACVAANLVDCVGLGRMALSYHDLPAQVLAGAPIERKKICRTFSDCTTAPRNGMISGCYPLDEFYKERDEFQQLVQLKKAAAR